MRHLFVGNFGYDTRESELERLFSKYGTVNRVEMKAGSKSRYAFVYFEDESDAGRAIRWLHNTPCGDEKRRLKVEWAKGKPGKSGLKPTKTLFVFNFDPLKTTNDDIKRHFEPYGNIVNVRIKGRYSFVKFATQEDATKAFEDAQGSMILDKPVTIEYAYDRSNERSGHYAGSRRRRSPDYERRRSPDYVRRSRTRSPGAGYSRYKFLEKDLEHRR